MACLESDPELACKISSLVVQPSGRLLVGQDGDTQPPVALDLNPPMPAKPLARFAGHGDIRPPPREQGNSRYKAQIARSFPYPYPSRPSGTRPDAFYGTPRGQVHENTVPQYDVPSDLEIDWSFFDASLDPMAATGGT